MTLRKYAIVDTDTGQVVNCIEYEKQPPHPVPGMEPFPHLVAIQHDQASIGWTYKDGLFTPPKGA